MIEHGADIPVFDTVLRAGALISGLYLERVSPHKKLKNFMFLAIATKVAFILITILVGYLESYQFYSVEPVYWYSVVVLMAFSVPPLALEKLNLFRGLIWLTCLVSLSFF